MSDFKDTQDSILEVFKQYSFEDVAIALLAINLWLPNISSAIKFELIYHIFSNTPPEWYLTQNQIRNYGDFTNFCNKLFAVLPSFPMMEDMFPETDWGEVKFYLDGKTYHVLYGGSIVHSYDYLSSSELVAEVIDKQMQSILNRSPLSEFKTLLSICNKIILEIKAQPARSSFQTEIGQILIPEELYWKEITSLVNTVNSNLESPNDFDIYSLDIVKITGSEYQYITEENLLNGVDSGNNVQYWFIKKGEKYYPLIPRHFMTVMLESWHKALSENKIIVEGDNDNQQRLSLYVGDYLSQRVKEEDFLELVSAIKKDGKLDGPLFAGSIHSKNKLYLVYCLPISVDVIGHEAIIQNTINEVREAVKLITERPHKLAVHSKKQFVTVGNERNDLDIVVIYLLPTISLSYTFMRRPDGDDNEIYISLNEFLGIADELDPEEYSDFFNFYNQHADTVFGGATYLDFLSIYRNFHGVLVEGAIEPTSIAFFAGAGSNFRYESLSSFWKIFPDCRFLGHPRSWAIVDKESSILIFASKKRRMDFTRYLKINESHLFIAGPYEKMSLEQGGSTDLLAYMIADSFRLYNTEAAQIMPRNSIINVVIAPYSLVDDSEKEMQHLSHLKPAAGKVYAIDTGKFSPSEYGVRIVFDETSLGNAITNAADRSFQISIFTDILQRIHKIHPRADFQVINDKLFKEATKPNRHKIFSIRKQADYPQYSRVVYPSETDFKKAQKSVAEMAMKLGIKAGTYNLDEGQVQLNSLRETLVQYVNQIVEQYQFQAVGYLIGRIDAVINENLLNKAKFLEAVGQDVDYEPVTASSDAHEKYIRYSKNYRYLIEKFVQLQPQGSKEFNEDELKLLLTLVDRLLSLYESSDSIRYGVHPIAVKIDDDYILDIIYEKRTIEESRLFSEEMEKIRMEVIGKLDDNVDPNKTILEYANALDVTFKSDFGFRFSDVIGILTVLSAWATVTKQGEKEFYSATLNEIVNLCLDKIANSQRTDIEKAVNFLILESSQVLKTSNGTTNPDLPVWEYKKRIARYTIRPIINLSGSLVWGAHSTNLSGKLWSRIIDSNQLPADFEGVATKKLLEDSDKEIEDNLVTKTEEIANRYTTLVKKEIELHKIDKKAGHPNNLGDYDILAYLKDKKILLNIECKKLNTAHCLKDARYRKEKLFGRTKSTGEQQKGELEKFEKRVNHLKQNYSSVLKTLEWEDDTDNVRVVSVLVSDVNLLWMRFPVRPTEVEMMPIVLLDDTIKGLLQP